MKVFLDTVGCRLNQSEIEAYARQFHAAGHELVSMAKDADLAVVNTCAVTSAAASDSRQKIRQASRNGVQKIVVTGCWSTLQPDEATMLPAVVRLVPNMEKDFLVSDLLDVPRSRFELEPVERFPVPGARMRTRAFIKVQDGCDNRCTFCVTTVARGGGRSRTIKEVIADVHAAVDPSSTIPAKEIVLTGVHLGSWGHDFSIPRRLHHLVQAILQKTEVPRLRLSSLEPWDLDEGFFDLWADSRLCRHLHLPLQSGCGATLRRMARKTTPETYASLIAKARQKIPGVAITTDIITGFPGESEAEFAASLDFVSRMEFAGGHVFTYSPRPGTAASRMTGQVVHAIRKERNAAMRSVLAEATRKYQQQFIGQVIPVLWESTAGVGPDGWLMDGLTDNYLRVRAITSQPMHNEIVPVRLLSVQDKFVFGDLPIEHL